MDTGIYIALSKQIGIFNDMAVTANNIANIDTTGYHAEKLLFSDFLVPSTRQEKKVAFSNDVFTFRNTEQGTLKITNSPLDAAIEGTGYFTVQTPLGVRYTRNGNFRTNQEGFLVTKEGYTVLDDSSQPVQFDELDTVIQIRDDGTVNVDDSDRAILKIVQFDNEQLLQRVGDTMYTSTAAPKPATDFRIVNGALERSNVKSFEALTHLLYVTRSATDSANLINTLFTLERKASDTLAKIYS
jgi:flagellar basal-body rod protein FlgF